MHVYANPSQKNISKIFSKWEGIITLGLWCSQNFLLECLLVIAELTFFEIPKELSILTVPILWWNKPLFGLTMPYLHFSQHKLLITHVSVLPIRLWLLPDLVPAGYSTKANCWMNECWMNVCFIVQPRILISLGRDRKWQG